MGIFNRTVQSRESWVHVLKATEDSSSDDAEEQADNIEDGGRPEQVVEMDDVLAAADINVLVVPTGDLHPVAAIVEVTAKAGVASDARCAESTAEMRAVHLLSFLLGCLGDVVAPVSVQWFQINVSGRKDAVHYGTAEGCDHPEADKDNRSHQHLPLVLNKV